MTKIQLIECFHQYRWAEIWQQVRSEADDDFFIVLRACLLAAWWQEPEEAEKLLTHITPQNTSELIFFIALTKTCLGDAKDAPRAINALKESNAPRWMGEWLALEYAGRTADYIGQARILTKIMKQKMSPVDWCYVACLQSLENPLADTKPLRKWLGKQSNLSPMAQILGVRIGLYSDESASDILHKIPSGSCAYAPALYRLTYLLPRQGLIRETIQTFDVVAKTGQIDKPLIGSWLSLCISHADGWDDFPARVNYIATLVPANLRMHGVISSYLLIHHWVNGCYKEAYELVKRFHGFLDLQPNDSDRMNSIFFRYILNLAVAWQQNAELYNQTNANSSLTVIGESHSLSSSNTNFDWKNARIKATSRFVMGVKMHHLSSCAISTFKTCVEAHIESTPYTHHLLFTIGEIDCRPDEGIWQVHQKKGIPLVTLIKDTVNGYLQELTKLLANKPYASITLQGIPAPGYKLEGKNDPGDKAEFLNMIRDVNGELKLGAFQRGWSFLDVYSATTTEEGLGNGDWHLDAYHLKPVFYTQAEKWLLTSN
jgi:hypothetical protein